MDPLQLNESFQNIWGLHEVNVRDVSEGGVWMGRSYEWGKGPTFHLNESSKLKVSHGRVYVSFKERNK